MLEKYLIDHCSPTLASIKTANLFTCEMPSEEELEQNIEYWNSCMEKKGISLIVLRKSEKKALVYVCRMDKLQKDLEKPGVASFLRKYGYEMPDAEYAVDRLKKRIQSSEEFPHEIGIFLSYPLGDVIGFIENAGKNCKCSGCWKVYCDECEAVRLFAMYKKCREIYRDLWSKGRSILQLTVAVG